MLLVSYKDEAELKAYLTEQLGQHFFEDVLTQVSATDSSTAGNCARCLVEIADEIQDEPFIWSDALLLLVAAIERCDAETQDDLFFRVSSLKERNNFGRVKLIQAMGLLSMVMKNSLSVVGRIVGRRREPSTACALAHLRALRRAYFVRQEEEIIQKIEGYSAPDNDDSVISESLLQHSLIMLYRTAAAASTDQFGVFALEGLALADGCLAREDRPDARRVRLLLNVCQTLATEHWNPEAMRGAADEVVSEWRQSLECENPPDLADDSLLTLVEALERLSGCLKTIGEAPFQPDVGPVLIGLAESALYFNELSSLSEEGVVLPGLIGRGFRLFSEQFLIRSVWSSVQHARAKLERLLRGDMTPPVRAYLENVKQGFEDIDSHRASAVSVDVLVTVGRSLPHLSPVEIHRLAEEHQRAGTLERFMVSILEQQLNKADLSKAIRAFQGGSPKAQRLLRDVMERLRRDFREDENEALINFANLLRYTLAFLVALQEKRFGPYDFIMSKRAGGKGEDAVEGDLQNSFYHFLLGSDIGFAVHKEPRMSTGRVDLNVNFGDIVFPVEVKREHRDVSWGHLGSNYISQAMTYTRGYDRLGVLMVLDLTEKDESAPLSDLENLVRVVATDDVADTPDGFVPDYVVIIVVPGNLPRPSDLSTYSRR